MARPPDRDFEEQDIVDEEVPPAEDGGWLGGLQDQFGTAPWWVTSTVVHVLLVLLTMLIVVSIQERQKDFVLAADILEEPKIEQPRVRSPIRQSLIEVDLPEIVEHPVFVHEKVEDFTHMETENNLDDSTARGHEDAISDVPLGQTGVVASIGLGGGGGGCCGRPTGGGRNRAALRAGGSRASESAVDAALAWLARHQEPDGHWDAQKYGGEGVDLGLTGLSILAFLSAGHTETVGEYRENVRRAVRWLVSQQQPNGCIGSNPARLGYHHSIAALALAEAYGMGRSPTVRAAAQRAVDYAVREHVSSNGGWRYEARDAADTSVTGWFIMQLKSARVAGLRIDNSAFAGAMSFLATVTREDGQCAYQPDGGPRRTMTAVGIVIRQFCGAPRTDRYVGGAANFLKARAPEWGPASVNFYYWYYGTLGMFQMGGDAWRAWNAGLRNMLVENQRMDKPPSNSPDDVHGSWDPELDEHGMVGGRVYTTAMGCLCLEVYYRYLPIYGGKKGSPKGKM